MPRKNKVKQETIREMVSRIVCAKDLLAAREQLTEFANCMEASANPSDFMGIFCRELNLRYQNIPKDQTDDFAVLEGQDSVVAYLYASATFDFQEPYCSFLLNQIVDQMKQACRRPRGNRLPKAEIEKILCALRDRFDILKEILAQDRLIIGLLDNSLYKANAVYTARFSEDGTCEHFIFVPHEQLNFGCPQSVSLIHEVGHLIHTGKTRKILQLPDSFLLVSAFMFPNMKSAPALVRMDIFADSFMMAATNGTELEELRPAPHMGREFRALLNVYFTDLIREPG